MTIEELIAAIPTNERALVGIGGPPGAGKTTLAHKLADCLPSAVAVSMDGWHLSNAQLIAQDKVNRKGAPDTFDYGGFARMLYDVQSQRETDIYLPTFEHGVGEPIAASIRLGPEIQVVIFEGNYLLMQEKPWSLLSGMFDTRIYCDAPWSVCRERLIQRKIDNGKSQTEAVEWADRVDFANYQTVQSNRQRQYQPTYSYCSA